MKFYVLLFILLFNGLLTACGQVAGLNLGQYPDPTASKDKFLLCHGYGCSYQTQSNFTPKEWKSIERIFKYKSKDAAQERMKIAQAIALMEQISGAVTGTQNDLPKAPLKRQSNMELDCIDETVNTTKYLTFLQNDGLLKFHRVANPVYKGLMINGVYPHNSASIEEIVTGQFYVVDSYIYANGQHPDIRAVDNWLKFRVEDLDKAHNAMRAAHQNIQ